MPQLTTKQVWAMECEHSFVDVPHPYGDKSIRSYKRCVHCHTARTRYADGSLAYQLPLDSNHIEIKAEVSATGVSVMTCGHEGEE